MQLSIKIKNYYSFVKGFNNEPFYPSVFDLGIEFYSMCFSLAYCALFVVALVLNKGLLMSYLVHTALLTFQTQLISSEQVLPRAEINGRPHENLFCEETIAAFATFILKYSIYATNEKL